MRERFALLKQMTTERKQCIQASYGYQIGDSVIITEDAITKNVAMNFHGKIKYINRHKREVVIQAVFSAGNGQILK